MSVFRSERTATATATATTTTVVAQPLLGVGTVRHARVRPVQHAFAYPTYFVLLPMRQLRQLRLKNEASNSDPTPASTFAWRWGGLSFAGRDHGDGRADALSWLEELLNREGVHGVDGEIWLHTYPRVLGYVFKPVSFWYCHRGDGGLVAVVVEVNNTFGERHCYVLRGSGATVHWGEALRVAKVLHVSPFCSVSGDYRFRFLRTLHQPGAPARTVVRIEHGNDEGLLLTTSVSGVLEPLTSRAAWRVFFRWPWMTLAVIVRIHWQALLLWRKRVPFFHKPAPPTGFVSR